MSGGEDEFDRDEGQRWDDSDAEYDRMVDDSICELGERFQAFLKELVESPPLYYRGRKDLVLEHLKTEIEFELEKLKKKEVV